MIRLLFISFPLPFPSTIIEYESDQTTRQSQYDHSAPRTRHLIQPNGLYRDQNDDDRHQHDPKFLQSEFHSSSTSMIQRSCAEVSAPPQKLPYLRHRADLISLFTHELDAHQTNLLLRIVAAEFLDRLIERIALGIFLEIEVNVLCLILIDNLVNII